MGSDYTPGEVTLPLGTNDYGDIQPGESLILGIHSSLWHRYQGSSKALMLKRQNSKQKPKKLNRHTSLTRSDRREGGGGGRGGGGGGGNKITCSNYC